MDVCCLQRPLDDRSQLRVNVEAEAVLTILRLAEAGQIDLLSSEVIEYELGRIPDFERRLRASQVMALSDQIIELNDEIESRAEKLVKEGVKPVDALHLATASSGRVDRFCTCDDRILKKRDHFTGVIADVHRLAARTNDGDCAMTPEMRPLTEVTRHATDLLMREIGVVDTLRFLGQFRNGSGDYSNERRQLLDDLTLQQVIAEIKKQRQHKS
jgi:predicted nucleic acid-binding protein